MHRTRLAAALAGLAGLVLAGGARAELLLRWNGGSFENTSPGPANDFHVRITFSRPAGGISAPVSFGNTGPFDVTSGSASGGDVPGGSPYVIGNFSFSDKNAFVNRGSSITIGGMTFAGTLSQVSGVEMFWTLDGVPTARLVGDTSTVVQVPEPHAAGLLGAALAGLLLFGRRGGRDRAGWSLWPYAARHPRTPAEGSPGALMPRGAG